MKEKDSLIGTRTAWQDYVNQALEDAGSTARVDARSHADRGLNREPEPKLGKAKYTEHLQAKARRDLAERTRWMNGQRRILDASVRFRQRQKAKGRYQDPFLAAQNAEIEAQKFYQLNQYEAHPPPSPDLEYHGRLHPPPGPEIER